MTFSVTLATEMPAGAASSCKTTYTRYETIKEGRTGAQVRSAQCLLNQAGYRVRVDGSFSAADSAQLERFQRTHHVNPSGNLYASSWTALLSRGSRPALQVGASGESVKRLQRSLTATGRPVKATGYYGSVTRNAVVSVQRARHLSATGRADASVWRVLQGGDPIVTARKVVTRPAPIARAASGRVSASSRGARALAFAKRQLGDRYRWGASGPNSWDCSGLTRGAWKAAGISLPHNARAQFGHGRRISKSQLRPGDLVFFYRGIKHVAIYAGGGKVIHAPRPGKRVTYIKMSYMPYEGARRPG